MSVVANFIGTLDYPEFHVFAGTSTEDAYPVPASNKGLTLAAFTFVNDTSGAIQCKLYHYSGGSASPVERIAWTGNVAANSSAIVESNPIRLRPNDVIRGRVAATGVTLKLSLITQLETGR